MSTCFGIHPPGCPHRDVEFDIITGLSPVLMASMTVGTKYYWLERDGFIHFAVTREQAEWDRREYILEILEA